MNSDSRIKAADLFSETDFESLEEKGFSKSYASDFLTHESLNFTALTPGENASLRKPGQGSLVEALIRESLHAQWSGNEEGTLWGRPPSEYGRLRWADAIGGRPHHSVGSGQESDVFRIEGDDFVYKFRKVNRAKGVVGSLLDLVYHNTLFPDEAYTFYGFLDDERMLVSQPAVNIKRDAEYICVVPTVEQIIEALPFGFAVDENNDGVKDTSSVPGRLQVYSDLYVVFDLLRGENAVIDADSGKIRFIDPRIVPNCRDGVLTGVEQFGKHGLPESVGSFDDYREFVDIRETAPESLEEFLEDLADRYAYSYGELFDRKPRSVCD